MKVAVLNGQGMTQVCTCGCIQLVLRWQWHMPILEQVCLLQELQLCPLFAM